MPRKPEVDQHAEREKIIKALIRGDTFRVISGRYGVSKSALQRYLSTHLMERAAKAKRARDLKDAEILYAELDRLLEQAHKIQRACDKYLQDPHNPDEYDFGPRAEETEVTYVKDVTDKGTEILDRASLQELLDRIERDAPPREVKYRHADPRVLVIKAGEMMGRHLELLAKIQGQIQEHLQVNIVQTTQFVAIKEVILQATADHPEVRNAIVDGLVAIEDAGSSD